ncbi:hypothetical protein FHE66_02240 [Georgenia sp. 311]|uniref:DUF1772 domain-containing protein n=1 Tax=Georgenia wutianyii TaxID=2585135 RepID=A0ABX5VN32_9MICO|nr:MULTISPECIES: hypothetical protein [Georgenia]QDB79917.1 hypothetical protein FE251_11425 [Georgenia wutianyii]TNC19692.1 hypothetical protein FHE66_02240 [Georgenia sp. 311]
MTTDTATRPTTLTRLRLPALIAYTWVMILLLGAILLETLMVYPNVFADPPDSLALTMDFLSVTGPSDFFPPFGMATWAFGAAALVTTWRQRDARGWVALSLAMVVCEGIASVLFFWPRNEILFVEGTAVHSADYLVQVAREFETWHWASRMVFNATAALAAFVAFLRVHRAWVLRRADLG